MRGGIIFKNMLPNRIQKGKGRNFKNISRGRLKLRGFYFKFAILIEMLIKGEDGFNLEALH